ncbi:MAG TPA: hypothetical protein VMW50_10095 [Dehalococcoidia bacterium]|jgi:fructose-1-phosphate kinase PfkB-like protein|nr:hypothetical protein [Dehalococcoidia bacterium]
MTEQIKQQFLNLACSLSPENLTCDGELPKHVVQAKYADLMRQWKKLEKQVGRKVSEEEAYNFEIKKTGGYWSHTL